ncbi:LAMI_0H03972g1_1 [Lachancea mirantina]|uniref:LAMI_0H03972g1_1 n=1 Tax=Lachancea mirantina TaxID=1230905 RepID=A0A1G4KEH5_9SACH|nr:LAMI_0H03972g1_1 [Lachancea mirantina]
MSDMPEAEPPSEDPHLAEAEDEELDGNYSNADNSPLYMTPVPSSATPSKVKKSDSQPAVAKTKVPMHLLEKRRLGRQKAAEEFAEKLRKVGIEKVENLGVRQSGLFKTLMQINQKNYSSDYLRRDDQIFAMRERKSLRNAGTTTHASPDAVEDDDQDENMEDGDEANTIVIHPGSSLMKIGLATDVLPQIVPNSVSVPNPDIHLNVSKPKSDHHDTEKYEELKDTIQQDFKQRMRFYKRKILPNSHEAVANFNLRVEPEIIPEHNDLHRIEWIQRADRIYYGEEATRCLPPNFVVRHPFRKGRFNVESTDYKSVQELFTDVMGLINHALTLPKLNIGADQYPNYKVVIVVPDAFDRTYVENFIRLLLVEMKFQAVAVIQESLASCYGAGIGDSACVVDIGARQTKIACVDEGLVVQNSVVTLDFGGDDITRLFTQFLLDSNFPYKVDLNTPHGWGLMQHLKEQFATFQDANVTIQLYNFIKRVPGRAGAEKFEFKVFDEVMTAPMALFFPEIFKAIKPKQTTNDYLMAQLPASKDIFSQHEDNMRSITQIDCQKGKTYCEISNDAQILDKILNLQTEIDKAQSLAIIDSKDVYTSLEKAIIESITNACAALDGNFSKMTNLYSNLLVVGGSSKFPSLDFILTDRINIWRPRLLSVNSFPTLYADIAKQIKEQEQLSKATDSKEELDVVKEKEGIQDIVEETLQKHWEKIEALGGNEVFFPIDVLPPPREMDPAVLTWKGGSVFARIKLIEELYVTASDWDVLGSRILKYKCIFDY